MSHVSRNEKHTFYQCVHLTVAVVTKSLDSFLVAYTSFKFHRFSYNSLLQRLQAGSAVAFSNINALETVIPVHCVSRVGRFLSGARLLLGTLEAMDSLLIMVSFKKRNGQNGEDCWTENTTKLIFDEWEETKRFFSGHHLKLQAHFRPANPKFILPRNAGLLHFTRKVVQYHCRLLTCVRPSWDTHFVNWDPILDDEMILLDKRIDSLSKVIFSLGKKE